MQLPDFRTLGTGAAQAVEAPAPHPEEFRGSYDSAGAVGQSLANIGNTAENSAINIKQISDIADVNNAMATQFQPKLDALAQNYYSLQGKAAVDAAHGTDDTPSYGQQVQNLVSETASGLSGSAQRAFIAQAQPRVDNELYRSAMHAGQQQINYAEQAYGAVQSNGLQDIQNHTASGDIPALNDDIAHMKVRAVLHQQTLGNAPDSDITQYHLNTLNYAIGKAWLGSLPQDQLINLISPKNAPTSVPQDMGGDTVKPYTGARVAEVQSMVAKPSPYDDLFQKYGAQYGVDPSELKLHAAVESSMNPKADNGQSSGLMGLQYDTAKNLGVTNPLDPEQSIMGAAKLMAQNKAPDTKTADLTYYGGSNQANWGPNTQQYAANLAAVRSAQTPSLTPPVNIFKGTPAENIPPEELNSILNKQMPALRGQIESKMQDDISMATDGKPNPGAPLTPQIFSAAYGPLAGADRYQQYQDGLTLGKSINGLQSMTPQQQNDLLKSNEPKPGPGYAEQEKNYGFLVKAAVIVNKQRSDDAAGYVQRQNPVVAQKFQAASNDPTKMDDYANTLNAAYDQYGIAPENRNFVPVQTAQGMVQKLTTAAPQDVPGMMDDMQKQYGKYTPQVMGDLMNEKLPAVYNAMFASSDPIARNALAATLTTGQKTVEAALPPSSVKDINEAVEGNSDMIKLNQTLAATGDTGTTQAQFIQATKMTAMGLMVKNGMDANSAVKTAVQSLTSQYDFMDHARVPKGTLDKTEYVTNQTMNQLRDDQLMPVANPRNLPYKPEDLTAAALAAAKGGYWVTNKDDSGLERRDNMGLPVLMKNGSRLSLSFDQIKQTPAAPSAYGNVSNAVMEMGQEGL